MKVASLFTGIGGFDLGFEAAGMNTVLQVERDKYCLSLLNKHWPETERYRNVRSVGRGTINGHGRTTLDGVDLVCGGFPCQDLSLAGSRRGLAGRRSGLWFEFLRVVQEHHPEYVVIENVTGLLSSHGGKDFAVLLQGLGNRGYALSWRVLNSKYFGVGQQRRRVYIVGNLGSPYKAFGALFPEPKSLRGDFKTITEQRAESTSRIQKSTRKSGSGFVMAHGQANAEIFDNICPTLTLQHETPIVIDPLVGDRPRRLTPIEYERLQGFPDGWTESGVFDGDEKVIPERRRYAQLGNAVTVNVAQWIGKNIMEQIG